MTAESDDSPALIETPPQQPRVSALFVVEESPSIFEWRGFPVSKKIIHFRCDADAIGMAETGHAPFFCSAKSLFRETFESVADSAILLPWPGAKILGQHVLQRGHCAPQLRAQSLCVR